MQFPKIPVNESQRLEALNAYSILDTMPSEEYEDITQIASEICGTPISLITFVDAQRQWFKSNHGIGVTETPREFAFCAHAILSDNVFVVIDSRNDIRFFDNPLVTGYPNVIFYAGVPLVNPDGYPLGTLCVIDAIPRELTEQQIQTLKTLSRQVVRLLEIRKTNKLRRDTQITVEDRNRTLEKFALIVSHDIRSPLNNIISLNSILKAQLEGKIGADDYELFEMISKASSRLKDLIEGILSDYIVVGNNNSERAEVNLAELFDDLQSLLNPRNEYQIRLCAELGNVMINENALRQILLNLINNAIKYNDKEQVEITVFAAENDSHYLFQVRDNGIGISEKERSKIFEIFSTLGYADRFKNVGTGIGLSTVKRLAEKFGGSVSVASEVGKGSTFEFSLAK